MLSKLLTLFFTAVISVCSVLIFPSIVVTSPP
nr:MAG TPA: hypothetical protein [Caudoviricetes sp.]